MQTGRQCEDAWWAGAVVISGVFWCTIPVPSAIPSLHFGHPLRTKSILLGCPPHLMQKTGAKGTLVSDLFCLCMSKRYPAKQAAYVWLFNLFDRHLALIR